MKDIRLTVRAQNNRLISAIEEKFGSQAEMVRQTEISFSAINSLVCLRVEPVNGRGWTNTAQNIAAALGVYPVDLWPEHMQNVRLAQRTASVSLDLEEVAAIASEGADRSEMFNMIAKASDALFPREKSFVAWLLAGNMSATLDEKGEYLGVTRERARQIEVKALRKMRQRLDKRHNIRALAS